MEIYPYRFSLKTDIQFFIGRQIKYLDGEIETDGIIIDIIQDGGYSLIDEWVDFLLLDSGKLIKSNQVIKEYNKRGRG